MRTVYESTITCQNNDFGVDTPNWYQARHPAAVLAVLLTTSFKFDLPTCLDLRAGSVHPVSLRLGVDADPPGA